MSETALISGASSGLGAGIARYLAAKVSGRGGLQVEDAGGHRGLGGQEGGMAGGGCQGGEGRMLVLVISAQIRGQGGRALVRAADLTDRQQVLALGTWVRQEVIYNLAWN